MNPKHLGSSFDDFLKEDNLLDTAEIVAIQRVLAFQLDQMMQSAQISKATLAERMRVSPATLKRLLNPNGGAVTLQTIERAALALGKQLRIELV